MKRLKPKARGRGGLTIKCLFFLNKLSVIGLINDH